MIRVPLILTILLVLVLGCAGESSADEARPNILFILTDDMREDDLQYMPKTQELVGSEGLTYQNSYATYPRCCPARATILTGLYTHNHGVKVNEKGWQTFRQKGHEERTIAKALDDAGYRTALFGKYLNDYTDATHVPPGWDEWHAALGKSKRYYYDYNMSENGVKVHYGSKPEDYRQDVIAQKADTFIRGSGPFFAYVSVTAPHGPSTPAPRHKSLDMSKRARSLQAVDDLVEKLVMTLKETGQMENTYIFFTSDNGWMQGEHGFKGGKLTYYEESASVPLLVRGPGVPAGVSRELAGNHDYAPTWANIAGISFSADGRSLFRDCILDESLGRAAAKIARCSGSCVFGEMYCGARWRFWCGSTSGATS